MRDGLCPLIDDRGALPDGQPTLLQGPLTLRRAPMPLFGETGRVV